MRVLEDTKTAHIVGQQLLGQVIQERDESRKEASRLHEAGNGLIAQLNAAQAEIERLTADNCRLVDEFNAATKERDEANQAAEARAENECNAELTVKVRDLVQQLLLVTADRDNCKQQTEAVEREKQLTWENLQRMIRKCDAVILERDVSRDENYRLREERNKLNKENEGLRADALAYPPQRIEFTQYCNLKADHDRQVIMIETLQEGLKRTEALLKVAQAQHIDDRLKGFLSVISQLADQAQDLLP